MRFTSSSLLLEKSVVGCCGCDNGKFAVGFQTKTQKLAPAVVFDNDPREFIISRWVACLFAARLEEGSSHERNLFLRIEESGLGMRRNDFDWCQSRCTLSPQFEYQMAFSPISSACYKNLIWSSGIGPDKSHGRFAHVTKRRTHCSSHVTKT